MKNWTELSYLDELIVDTTSFLAQVSKDQGVRTGVPGRGTPSSENQGVRAAAMSPGSNVQGVPVFKDQGVSTADSVLFFVLQQNVCLMTRRNMILRMRRATR